MFGEGKKGLVLVCEHEDPFSGSSRVLFNPSSVSTSAQAHLPRLIPSAQAAKPSSSGTVLVIGRLSRTECFPFSFFLKLISFWRATRNDVQTQ